MKIAVLTDSSAYLADEIVEQLDIKVVNNPVLFGNHVYHENADLTATQFYQLLKTEDVLPTTSQVSMGEMEEKFEALAAEGYTDVICIHLSSGISGLVGNLEAFAPSVTSIKVHVFDSKIDCAGMGNMVQLAATMAGKDKNVTEIMAKLTELRETTHVLFVVDDLNHLMRTGRLSNRSGFVGNILKIKPILTFDKEGKIIAIGKERKMKNAYSEIKAQFAEATRSLDYPVRIDLIDANNPDLQAEWGQDLRTSFPDMRFESGYIGPLVGVHTGEKCLGLIWSRNWESLID
ncbi:DegV family protein [Dellaglioa carnosa]|uniref:DegV family protein n=1 Tax=Dellaglioa carnosa TaxID=2995136 RepID=A0ABT4JNJ7_9LACO|nr:DegV family protein [Dellaglioa carnosa]MCZ2491407.1 DegV family protein [Dellaglioa carnosa]MCZ2493173.1 DegV family protein [Dellaglioa carnosa]MCZ2494485.1 DegV family protein [Dellaglioa carnosa]MDK1731099.1 DegV family protein [Dellaglioa carnosa]